MHGFHGIMHVSDFIILNGGADFHRKMMGDFKLWEGKALFPNERGLIPGGWLKSGTSFRLLKCSLSAAEVILVLAVMVSF